LVFITKAKDMSFVVEAKVTDFSSPDVKAKDTVSSRTFQGRLLTQYFIIYVGLKYTSSTLHYIVKSLFSQLFKHTVMT